jgi:hypothetical protein
MIRRFVLLLLSSTTMWLGGCATASKPEAMAVSAVPITQQHPASVQISVTGGKETSAAGASQIANEDIKSALETSIRTSRLFTEVVDAGDYRLDVFIGNLSQPKFGFNMTVTLEINWTLTRVSDQQKVWEKGISSTYTAKAGEAFAGVKRLRLANEGAARENIGQAIAALSTLELP